MRLEDEGKAKQKFENKMRILTADAEHKNVPTDLYQDEDELRKEMTLQDDNNISMVII